ncbi:AAA family ATPase [Kineosporia rhizophila]|uniref:AAA family ATPase n=1 Tax=Kineosporia TaxID=49184 RepID=UPI001E61B032|nr:AAA family ATPase [Kineosporia sp. NBRC 101677]MCE0537673.1 AAA family ATPase [Kineosporia rhizophila]
MTTESPAWLREVDFALSLHPHMVLTGNVRDQYPVPVPGLVPEGSGTRYVVIGSALWQVCQARGFAALAVLDPVTYRLDLRNEGAVPDVLTSHAKECFSIEDVNGVPRLDVRKFGALLRSLTEHRGPAIALLIPYAARMFPAAGLADAGMLEMLGQIDALAHQAKPTAPQTVPGAGQPRITPYNVVFWLCDRQEDLHQAFPLSNRAVRQIRVPTPTYENRYAAALAMLTPGDPEPGKAARAAGELAEVTHGMNIGEVLACGRVARDRQLPPERFAEAARLMRVGITEDPWSAQSLRKKLEEAEEYLNARVLGQERAVAKTLDVLYRSAVGLNGAHVSSSPNRPRGVLFLSGPTGVGKTELAKGIANLVLGSSAEPLRFDMSEFRADEAHQRLIGAPPGYVGYDAGGELTNAVRSNPVCVLLFDEVEKAHPRIFDLFLQILEDGRLTDSRGATVYFTECFLIFTSNLGVRPGGAETEPGPAGPPKTVRDLVHSGMDPRQVEELLRGAYEKFFNEDIGRPELRNRLGENYVALSYIDEATVRKIVDKGLAAVTARLKAVHGTTLVVGPDVRESLIEASLSKKDDGGRGVNNVLEAALVNPLARHLFARSPVEGQQLELADLLFDDEKGWVLTVR